MSTYLEFKDASCKNCYKCLRECPVKAIEVINHHAQIIESRCILCGRCTEVCPQNAKVVHSEKDNVMELIRNNKVIATVAPSFVSSFKIKDFNIMKMALGKLGFTDSFETAFGAKMITEEYQKLLESRQFKNIISSACPAVNRLIQLYYPDALKYLAPCDTPMIAHAKYLKKKHPDAKVVFIGPCIAKKREAKESNIVDGVLTFEDLSEIFSENQIELNNIADINVPFSESEEEKQVNKAKYYPISRGVIKSFNGFVDGYEYVAVDGVEKCREVLENIEDISGMFLELNCCEYACVNGPCSLIKKGSAVKANADIREYVSKELEKVNVNVNNEENNNDENKYVPDYEKEGLDFTYKYERLHTNEVIPSEKDIQEVLKKTGKFSKEDELNCGACGYNTCREKAWAVLNGYADVEMCVPYMRERAESMSYEVIQNSPNGILLIDYDFKIIEVNDKAKKLCGIDDSFVKGRIIYDFFDAYDFVVAADSRKNLYRKKMYVEKTKSYIELTIIILEKDRVMFGVLKDITEQTAYDEKIKQMKLETLSTTDDVIKKQMRVAQEIASLLGETTAETKTALLKLKATLQNDGEIEINKKPNATTTINIMSDNSVEVVSSNTNTNTNNIDNEGLNDNENNNEENQNQNQNENYNNENNNNNE